MTKQGMTSMTIFALVAATLAVTRQPWQYWAFAAAGTAPFDILLAPTGEDF